MIRGYRISSPPGEAIVTDRSCYNSGSGYCTFYDNDAINSEEEDVIVPEGEYICTGCNETITDADWEGADRDEIDKLHDW